MFLRCTQVQLQPANRYSARNCLTVASRGWGFLKPHPLLLCPWAIGPSCLEYGDRRRNHCRVQDGKLAVRVGATNGNVSIFTDRHAHTRTHTCTHDVHVHAHAYTLGQFSFLTTSSAFQAFSYLPLFLCFVIQPSRTLRGGPPPEVQRPLPVPCLLFVEKLESPGPP